MHQYQQLVTINRMLLLEIRPDSVWAFVVAPEQ